MATEKKPKKEKIFENNRKNQKHISNNMDEALEVARKNESVENAAIVEKYLVMAAHGSETNWKPKPIAANPEPEVLPEPVNPVPEAPEEVNQ